MDKQKIRKLEWLHRNKNDGALPSAKLKVVPTRLVIFSTPGHYIQILYCVTFCRYFGLSGIKNINTADERLGNEQMATNILQLPNHKSLMCPPSETCGMINHAIAAVIILPHIQKLAMNPIIGPRFFLDINSTKYENKTGIAAPTLK